MKKNIRLLSLSLLLLLSGCASTASNSSSSSSNTDTSSSISLAPFSELDISFTHTQFNLGEVYSLKDYPNVKFTSSDETILKVTSSSLIALKEGKVKLIASNEDDARKEFDINVVLVTSTNDYSYYDLDSLPYRRRSLTSIGNPNVLVIPVNIKDFDENATKENLNKINEVFNGTNNSKWESVKSFYQKSSYGKLDLNFIIPDEWFSINMNPEELMKKAHEGDGGADFIADKALEWYKDKYHTNGQELDLNNDGYIDSLWLVYDAPNGTNYSYTENYKGVDESAYWAFTAPHYDHYQKNDGVVGDPIVKLYAWASIDFMDNFHEEGTIDAHTYIHETGHLFGLNDYYSTYGSYISSPLGCVDMMDSNVGDHNAFSKFSLGWVKPTIVSSPCTMELKPFESSGNFLLIPGGNYNGSAFDEYFTVEYITPTGLNALDYSHTYIDNGVLGYEHPGIRITHVDARLKDENGNFTDDLSKATDSTITNTNYYSKNISLTEYYDEDKTSPMFQLTLMQKNIATSKVSVLTYGREYYKALVGSSLTYSKIDADDSLYHEGDFFFLGSTSRYRYLMPSNSSKLNRYAVSNDPKDIFPYCIKVDSLDKDSATISILELKS